MTPFMLRVQEVLAGGQPGGIGTVPSAGTPVPVATDRQVQARALAEQLVSEANGVLREHGRAIDLVDEPGPGTLRFTLTFGSRSAAVETVVGGGAAVARLALPDVAGDDLDESAPRRLTDEHEMEALLLTLIAGQSQLLTP